MYLHGTTSPQVGKTYAIHEHSTQDNHNGKGASTAVTVVNGTRVAMAHWEGKDVQKWECVDKDGWLGFICRASRASSHGAYLGFNASEVLVCEAQYQDKWEQCMVNEVYGKGCKWEMRKDDRLAYVGIVGGGMQLKMLRDQTTWWAFTEWTA